MNHKKSNIRYISISALAAAFLVFLLCFSLFHLYGIAKEKKPYWRFDSMKSLKDLGKLHNYRKCTKPVRLSKKDREKEKDYKDLLISGSGQIPYDTHDLLYKDLKGEAPEGAVIYMVDLRQESHGYLDHYPVSLHGKEHNDNNQGLLSFQVILKELVDLYSLYGVRTKVFSTNKEITGLTTKTICSKNIMTERILAEEAGFRYIRFSAQDHHFPQNETVDEFIRFYKHLPKNSWLHFHCLAGRGRTSVFMIMYDLIKNPDLSMKRAANRQHMIGGKRIVSHSTSDKWPGSHFTDSDRSERLQLFRKYVRANYKNNYKTSFSQWLKERDS